MSELIDQLGQHAGGLDQSLLDNEKNLIRGARPNVDFNKPYVAPGKDAHLPLGVTYHSYWKHFANGMGQHAREQIAALACTGLPVRLEDLGLPREMMTEELHEDVLKLYPLTRVTFRRVAIAIKHFIFHTPEQVEQFICPAGIRQHIDAVERVVGSTIVYTSWERDRVHPQFIQALDGIGQLWVPCQQNADAFVSSGMPAEKVRVIPYPFDPAVHTIERPTNISEVPKGKRFYHIGKWEPRKNQHALIGAFLLAYTPKDHASLFLKISEFGTGWSNYPSSDESIAFWLDDSEVKSRGWTAENFARLVRVVNEKVSEEDIRKIHSNNNIYVSSGLGEAWDIPAFDAKKQGNRLVYTGYGGPQDYASRDDVRIWDLVDGLTHVHAGYGWEPQASWAKYSTERLAEKLRQAEPPKMRRVPHEFFPRFSRSVVGAKMLDCIHELTKDCWEDLFR